MFDTSTLKTDLEEHYESVFWPFDIILMRLQWIFSQPNSLESWETRSYISTYKKAFPLLLLYVNFLTFADCHRMSCEPKHCSFSAVFEFEPAEERSQGYAEWTKAVMMCWLVKYVTHNIPNVNMREEKKSVIQGLEKLRNTCY